MFLYLLAAVQPGCHLREFVFKVCRTICILSEVDMQTLCLLSVVIVRSAKEGDRCAIMDEAVKFRNVKMTSDPKICKDGFVFMKVSKAVFKAMDHIDSVTLELS